MQQIFSRDSQIGFIEEERTVSLDEDVQLDIANVLKAHANYDSLMRDAQKASNSQTAMNFKQSFLTYGRAAFWSAVFSCAIIMEGYDTILIQAFFAYPQFVRKFGELASDGTYFISPPWQAALFYGANVGQIIGLLINGIACEWIGYRKTMIAALGAMTCFLFIPFFAPNIQVLTAGQVLQGIPWGIFQTLTTAYASEVCPVGLRAYLTTYVNLCWIMGQILANGILRACLDRSDEWGYKIPYAIQWVWPVPIAIGCLFAPESPWWLVRSNQLDKAEIAVKRLMGSSGSDGDASKTVLAMMIHTNEIEKRISIGTFYTDCFKKADRRRTEIACVVWAIQNSCGSTFMGYSAYFLIQSGIPVERAFDFTIIQFGIGFIATCCSFGVMRWYGRRTLYLAGLSAMIVILLVTGGLGVLDKLDEQDLSTNPAVSKGIASLLMVYTFVYDISLGPACYVVVSEISSTRLRAKTIVLARIVYNIVGIVNGVMIPYMLNPRAWNWQARSAFFFAGVSVLCLLYSYFRIPECKGRTYAELDVLFARGVPARRFKKTNADLFHGTEAASSPCMRMMARMEREEKEAASQHLEAASVHTRSPSIGRRVSLW